MRKKRVSRTLNISWKKKNQQKRLRNSQRKIIANVGAVYAVKKAKRKKKGATGHTSYMLLRS